jgi:hypothetical protein
MRSGRHLLLSFPLVWAVACDPRPADPLEIAIEPPALLAQEIRLPEPVSSESDGMGFAQASAVLFHGGRLAVLETGNDRLVLFDRDYRPVGHIGRPGAGPGELRAPVAVAARADQYAIMEGNNGRVSLFDTAGAFLRSFPVPNGFSNIGFGPSGVIYVNAHDGRNFLFSMSEDGAFRPFGERPWHRYPDRMLQAPTPRVGGYIHFAVADSGTVFVYDPVIAAIVAFDTLGRQTALRLLPGHVAERLSARAALVARDFGGDGRGAPANITDLSLTTDGRLLLMFSTTGVVGLVIETGTWTAREIRWAAGVDPRLSGFGGVLRNDTLYRQSADDLRLFLLTPQ